MEVVYGICCGLDVHANELLRRFDEAEAALKRVEDRIDEEIRQAEERKSSPRHVVTGIASRSILSVKGGRCDGCTDSTVSQTSSLGEVSEGCEDAGGGIRAGARSGRRECQDGGEGA